MECNCNNNNSNGGVIPWVRGNRLPLIICVYENVVTQEQVGDSTLTVNEMTRVPYTIQDNDTVTVTMKSGFRQVAMPFTTDGNKVMVTDNGELPTGAYTVEVTIERGDGARGRWQETRQVRIYENTSDAQLGEMYSIDADLFFYAKGDTGVGIANITTNPDNTLTITMTDGTAYTTTAMKGEKGDKGDKGDTGVSIVSFQPVYASETAIYYVITFSDGHDQSVAIPKGPQGDTGLTGNGISTTTLNSDYTLTIAYTDGTTYTTPSVRGAQGAQGVSVIGFTQTGETATNTMYNLVFSDGRTQSVAIPKGVKGDKGDKGDTGATGATGAQGPKGDTVIIGDEQTYTLYGVTGQNTDGAMTQKAITNATSFQGQQVNLSQYATKNCSISATTWYENNTHTKGKHKAIPVSVGDRFRLISSPSAYYGWLTSAYTGTTPSNGDDVPYVSGTTRQGNADGIIEAPEGAAYLCLTVVNGAGDSITNTLYKVNSIGDYLESSDSVPTQNSDKLVVSSGIYSSLEERIPKAKVLETYQLSDYTEKSCSLGSVNWYENTTTHYGKHKAIPVTELKYYRVDGTGFVGWVTSSYTGSYSNGDPIPYVSNTARIYTSASVLQAPKYAAYLIVCTYDGSGIPTTTTKVEEVDAYFEELKTVEDYVGGISDQYSVVDLASYSEVYGILNGNSATWYKAAGYYHIAVPVVAGEEYVVKSTGWIFYGLLQSYSTESNPVYSASAPSRIDLQPGAYKITIPSDCTYIVFTSRTGGTRAIPDLMAKVKILSWVLDKLANTCDTQVKLTFAHWNVGHFSYYDQNEGGNNTTISGADSDTMALRYKTMINKVSPDIFGICEYNPEFDLDGGLAKNLVFQNYKYQFIGGKKGYQCNSVFSNFRGIDLNQVAYTQHDQNTYYHSSKFYIGGVPVYIVETHLDWSSWSIRSAQMAQLITALEGRSHVIIGGDFNVGNVSQYQQFVDAGYTLANAGYIGNLPTYLKYLDDDDDSNDVSAYFDNIIVKGFAMSNIKVWDESGYVEGGLSDHSIISCDLLLLP